MNKNFKKFISILCCAAMMTGSAVFAENTADTAAAVEVAEKTTYSEDMGFLKSTGIFKEFDVTRNYDDVISRGEFIKATVEILGLGAAETPSYPVADLDVMDPYMGYVQTAISAGILSGYGEDVYDVSKNITLNEASKILLSALGYNDYFQGMASYPRDYMNKAKSVGLFYKLGNTANRDLVYQDVLRLLCNALEADKYSVFGSNETFMADEYNIGYVTDILMENSLTSLRLPAKNNNGYLRIGDRVFDDAEMQYTDYIGHNVRAYFDLDTDELLYLHPYKSEELVMNLGDIESVRDRTIRYTIAENQSAKRAEITADAYILYNGVANAAYDLANLTKEENGTVKLIDNNSDGKYEVVSIEASEVMMIERISTTDYTLVSDTGFKSLSDIAKEKIFVETNEGVKGTFETILRDDIVNIYIDKEKLHCKIVVTKNIIAGEVEKVNTTDGIVVIDGEEYEVEKRFLDTGTLAMGYAGKFYLDRYGRVAAAKKDKDGIMQYGYLISCGYDDSEETCIIKLLDDQGKINKYDVSEKVRIDGYSKIAKDTIKDRLKETGEGQKTCRQLIRYSLKYGKINVIDTVATGTKHKIYDTLTLGPQVYKRSNARYMRSGDIDLSSFVKLGTDYMMIDGFGFKVPKEMGDGAAYDDSYFKMVQKPDAEMPDYGVTPCIDDDELRIYDVDGGRFEIFVYYKKYEKLAKPNDKAQVVPPSNCKFVVVDKITQTLNEDDEVIYKVDTLGVEPNMQAGTTSFYTDDPVKVSKYKYDDAENKTESITLLEQGDILQIRADSASRIENCTLIYDTAISGAKNYARIQGMPNGTYYVDIGQVYDTNPYFFRGYFNNYDMNGNVTEVGMKLYTVPPIMKIDKIENEIMHIPATYIRTRSASGNPHTVVLEKQDDSIYGLYVIEK